MKNLYKQKKTKEFIDYIESWLDELPDVKLHEIVSDPKKSALISVDMINGFCKSGALASPRVAAIIDPVTNLMQAAWDIGIRHIILSEDAHPPDAVEFVAFPPHAIQGTEEAETVDAIKRLPFFDRIKIINKNSISSSANTSLGIWVENHKDVKTFFVVGDCTDLCTYQIAMYLKTESNARQLNNRVIVAADTVETYHRSVETAQLEGGLPHDGDLMHIIFLYHLALNGIEVVKTIR
ncbi:MAG: cysteine hydrolase [Anaerolineaceae bacterium]|nr:cysteine hydrolase [Anaerolineaceae bacterium]